MLYWRRDKAKDISQYRHILQTVLQATDVIHSLTSILPHFLCEYTVPASPWTSIYTKVNVFPAMSRDLRWQWMGFSVYMSILIPSRALLVFTVDGTPALAVAGLQRVTPSYNDIMYFTQSHQPYIIGSRACSLTDKYQVPTSL